MLMILLLINFLINVSVPSMFFTLFLCCEWFLWFSALSVDDPTNSASSFEIIDGLDQNDYKESKVNNGMCSDFYLLAFKFVYSVLYTFYVMYNARSV